MKGRKQENKGWKEERKGKIEEKNARRGKGNNGRLVVGYEERIWPSVGDVYVLIFGCVRIMCKENWRERGR